MLPSLAEPLFEDAVNVTGDVRSKTGAFGSLLEHICSESRQGR